MSFQTTVLQNGQWVTQTVDLQTVLKGSKSAPKPPVAPVAQPPRCGILTQTVIESPVVRHVLPCRLRSAEQADVAFVGDYFVQIRQYRVEDGQFHDIISKNDFDERIRNAAVIGSIPDSLGLPVNKMPDSPSPPFRPTDEDVDMLGCDPTPPNRGSRKDTLAPQMLLVTLEDGRCVFLVLRTCDDGSLEWVSSQCQPSNKHKSKLGHLLAVDPSSRYIAMGSSPGIFGVCELYPRHVLEERYLESKDLNPVKDFRPRNVNGVVQMMEFLFPKKNNEAEVIMLLFIARDEHTRMVLYEWDIGDDLASVLEDSHNGYRLSHQNRMPLFIIPLRVGSSFIAVYPSTFCIVQDAQLAPPEFKELIVEKKPPSRFYNGKSTPLWSSWARPFRLSQYESDCIYIAREDGCVDMLFVNDSVEVEASSVGYMDCSISTAFGVLFDDTPSDILVIAGEAGSGVVWKVQARSDPEFLMRMPNWAPAVDIATTHHRLQPNHEAEKSTRNLGTRLKGFCQEPDRLFATSGKAASGALVEFRRGLQANIGLQLDCDDTTTEAWLVPVCSTTLGSGHYLLMSTPDRSTVLQFPDDMSEVRYPDENTGFDLSSRTCAIGVTKDGAIIQVTETCIACAAAGRESASIKIQDLVASRGAAATDMVMTHAAVMDEHVVFSTTVNHSTLIHLCRIGSDLETTLVRSFPVTGEVTCLAFATFQCARYILAGSLSDDVASLLRLSLDGIDAGRLEALPVSSDETSIPVSQTSAGETGLPYETVKGYISISSLEIDDCFVVILGTREGSVITIALQGSKSFLRSEKFGITPATTNASMIGGTEVVTVCCDSKLWALTGFDRGRTKHFKSKYQVWPVDMQETKPSKDNQAPSAGPRTLPIVSATILSSAFARTQSNLPLLLTSGSQIVMADAALKPQVVPWTIPLYATPSRVMYSHLLKCLVVGVVDLRGRTTLKFIDINTGKDVSCPVDKSQGDSCEYVAGLGNPGDSVLGLSKWIYQKSNHTFFFILSCTRYGLQVISPTVAHVAGKGRVIQYCTRFRRKTDEPVRSIMGIQDGIIYCQGTTLKWEILDSVDKKLVLWKSFQLSSPAKALSVWAGDSTAEDENRERGTSRNTRLSGTMNNRGGKGKKRATGGYSSGSEEETPAETPEVEAQKLERRMASRVIVTMAQDSVSVLAPGPDTEMMLVHSDPRARKGVDAIECGMAADSGPVLVTSDATRGLTGLWVPWQQPGCNCEVLFEAELVSSITRLVGAQTRPGWLQAQRKPSFGIITGDGSDGFGISVDGSLWHLQLVGIEAWAVLKLVLNLAEASAVVCPFGWHFARDYLDDPEPVEDGGFEMHIRGDVLRRVVEKKALEGMFAQQQYFEMLVQKLQRLDKAEAENGGIWAMAALTPPYDESVWQKRDLVFDLVYSMMDYYLATVI